MIRDMYPVIAASEKTISIEMIAELVRKRAVSLRHAVNTFKIHPSYDSRKNLLARCNEMTGAFHLMLELNGYKEVPDHDVREQVTYARQAVESLYAKSGPKTSR